MRFIILHSDTQIQACIVETHNVWSLMLRVPNLYKGCNRIFLQINILLGTISENVFFFFTCNEIDTIFIFSADLMPGDLYWLLDLIEADRDQFVWYVKYLIFL